MMNAWDKLREKQASDENRDALQAKISKLETQLAEMKAELDESGSDSADKDTTHSGLGEQHTEGGWFIQNPSNKKQVARIMHDPRALSTKDYTVIGPSGNVKRVSRGTAQKLRSLYQPQKDVGLQNLRRAHEQYKQDKDMDTSASKSTKLPNNFTTAEGKTYVRDPETGGYMEQYYHPDKGNQIGGSMLGQVAAAKLWKATRDTSTANTGVNPVEMAKGGHGDLARRANRYQGTLQSADTTSRIGYNNRLNNYHNLYDQSRGTQYIGETGQQGKNESLARERAFEAERDKRNNAFFRNQGRPDLTT